MNRATFWYPTESYAYGSHHNKQHIDDPEQQISVFLLSGKKVDFDQVDEILKKYMPDGFSDWNIAIGPLVAFQRKDEHKLLDVITALQKQGYKIKFRSFF